MSAREVIANHRIGYPKTPDGLLLGSVHADAILAALAEAGFVLMKADAVTKHKAWCPALSQCECEGSE